MSSVSRKQDNDEWSPSWPPDEGTYLEEEAAKRGISTKALLAKLVETAARDKMVTAILDDEVEQS